MPKCRFAPVSGRWLPEDGILITGDILVAPIHYAFDSPMLDWGETLERIAALDAETIIPGHGQVQRDKRYLARVQMLLEGTVDAMRNARNAGVAYADLASTVNIAGSSVSSRTAMFGVRGRGVPILAYDWLQAKLGCAPPLTVSTTTERDFP